VFGIELDKLLFVGVLVGLIVGPTRLNEWRRKLPQVVGRVHALYQQGRAQVTRDLDDMAPDWREYDPRQLDPRRVLRELGADVRKAAESDGGRVGSGPRPGEAPVESEAGAADERGGRQPADGGGDHVEAPAHAARPEEAPSELVHRRKDPREGEDGAEDPQPPSSGSRTDEKKMPDDVHVARVGGRDRVKREEESVDGVRPPRDGRGGGVEELRDDEGGSGEGPRRP
jgi:sec-independent protein translocase protein TatB